jgi:2-succinyl-6-hydroxy-2,4-cyclohexadiene-1-carboxylate synthase
VSELIELGGVLTRLRRVGRGSRLVLVHGFTGSIESMAELADLLAARHEVVSFDVVGHGGSAVPAEASQAQMSVATGQLLGALDDRRGHVVGYSMGGRVALVGAARSPERLLSVTVIGSHPGIEDGEERAARRRADDRMADAIEAKGMAWFVDEWMAKPIFASQRRMGEAALRAARDRRLRNDPVGLANSMRGMGTGAQEPVWAELAGLDVPLLYVAGANDEKFVELGRRLVATMPRAEFVAVEGVGHAAHEEDPERVADLILEHTARSEG